MLITSSIVTYNNYYRDISLLVGSCSNSKSSIVSFLMDNSVADQLSILGDKIGYYIHNPSNPGFGAAHNIAIKKAIDAGSKYHFIINPDIKIDSDVFTPMINYMEKMLQFYLIILKVKNQ